MRKCWSMLGLAALAAALAAVSTVQWPGSTKAADAPDKAAWTLMLYFDADNDLEADTIRSLAKLAEAGGSDDVRLVLLVDRSPLGEKDGKPGDYTTEDLGNIKDWSGAKLLTIEDGRFVELADWGDVNIADPKVLTRFALTAAKKYPADKYALVLNDHGDGWTGLCQDETHDDSMTLAKLSTALQAIDKKLGKLELVGFDACLMANLETAHAVAPYAHFMVASEEDGPGECWDWPPMLKALQEKPGMNGAQLGERICHAYLAHFEDSDDEDLRNEGLEYTLSVIDLEKVPDLEEALSDFVKQGFRLLRDSDGKGWSKLASARSHAEEYGKEGEDKGSEHHDLLHLAQLLRKEDPDAADSCDTVIRALKAAVVHSVHGKERPHANGLSIYFPRDGSQFDEDSQKDYSELAFSRSTKWGLFLKKYVQIAAGDKSRPQIEGLESDLKTIDSSKQEVATVTAKVSGEDVADLRFVLAMKDEDKKVIIGQLPSSADKDGELSAKFSDTWMAMGNGDKWTICPILEVEDKNGDDAIALVPAQVQTKGSKDWIDVILRFYINTSDKEGIKGKFVSAYTQTKGGPRERPINMGDVVRPRYLVIDAEGHEELRPAPGDHKFTIKKKGGLRIGAGPIGKATFLVGFTATNLEGKRAEAFVEIEVK